MGTDVDIPQLFDYKAAAQALHLSHFTLRRWVCEKRIEHIKLGGRVFFTRQQIARTIANRAVDPIGRSVR